MQPEGMIINVEIRLPVQDLPPAVHVDHQVPGTHGDAPELSTPQAHTDGNGVTWCKSESPDKTRTCMYPEGHVWLHGAPGALWSDGGRQLPTWDIAQLVDAGQSLTVAAKCKPGDMLRSECARCHTRGTLNLTVDRGATGVMYPLVICVYCQARWALDDGEVW